MTLDETIQLATFIYRSSFFVFPFLVLLLYFRKKISRRLFIILLFLALTFIWSRFVETKIITLNETRISADFNQKIALIADMHLGAYKDKKFLERVVEKINQASVDYTLIAGDFTYAAKPEDLSELFASLKALDKPVYAVLGNHDVDKSIQPFRDNLVSVLKANDIYVLNNEIISLPNFTLVGLGDAWTNEDKVSLLDHLDDKQVIVLTHNPDTITKYTDDNADFTLTGHTHCGQVRLPFLYKFAIPTSGDFDKGLSTEAHTKLFITCGLGEVGLPMRLFNPPTIDILYFANQQLTNPRNN